MHANNRLPLDPELTTRALAEEFGFETTARYHDRHREAFALIREGKDAPPQPAAHGDRPMYAKWR